MTTIIPHLENVGSSMTVFESDYFSDPKVLDIVQKRVRYRLMRDAAKKKFIDDIINTKHKEVHVKQVTVDNSSSALTAIHSTAYGDFEVNIRLQNDRYEYNDLKKIASHGLPSVPKDFKINVNIKHPEFSYTAFCSVDSLVLPGMIYDELYERVYNAYSHMETTYAPQMWHELEKFTSCFDALKRSALQHYDYCRAVKLPTTYQHTVGEVLSRSEKYQRYTGDSIIQYCDLMMQDIDEDVLFNLTLLNVSPHELNAASQQMGYWHKNTEVYTSDFELFLLGNVE